MKDYYKKANFYYILIPAIIGLWALIAWEVSLPAAEKKWARNKKQYTEAQSRITKILELDPERLEYEEQKGRSSEFNYTDAIDRLAKRWNIGSSNYSLHAGREIKRRGQKTKGATVTIKQINIEKYAQFLSSMLIRWPDLQCERLKLTKLKEGPDTWKVEMAFTYYY